MPANRSESMSLLQGTLDLLVLRSLESGPRHGYGIARWLAAASGDRLLTEEGSLYPALHRMERAGWLHATWGLTESGRRAKFYKLTDDGRDALSSERSAWRAFVRAVDLVLRTRKA
jgi:PadR family transcriptional regulator PadR